MSHRSGIRTTSIRLMAVMLIGLMMSVTNFTSITMAAPPQPVDPANPDFGPNVKIFDPSMSTASIQSTVNGIAAQQTDDEMGSNRYALLFKPGTYGTAGAPLQMKVGYYTELAGLGASPTDVSVNGKIEVYNRCLGPDNCIALNNFWRTLSNLSLTVNGTGQDGCRASANFWAVSQAVSMRRVNISGGNLSLILHRWPAVRQWRLHCRLEPAIHHQRLAAAVAHPQQPGG